MVYPDRTEVTVCSDNIAADTRSDHEVLVAFPTATMVTRTRPSVSSHVHCLSRFTSDFTPYKFHTIIGKSVPLQALGAHRVAGS